ncbi:methyltransferase domain-containing protein [Syntrophotalea acetylenivorans]|uniref:Methyltransferase domain-containing protein n=1 Tax=Syntrophotalea acetylenivorans TaxID=1842532 RepID=A0A1L3GLE7_9BACT|nr:methyltransferase [Syntrophotalea acetylenivorans]APG26744.1 methyltransferase domain-containing protein [Syntrophotalea acetylenivorans]
MDRSSRNRLNHRHSHLFSEETLFHRIARSVCRAECLPRKELFEAWEMARRVRRRFRGGRVIDLACGHGLLAHVLLVLDDSSAEALAGDVRLPESAGKLAAVLQSDWPRLQGRIHLMEQRIDTIEIDRNDLVVSAHACGGLTDQVIQAAIKGKARVAVLPCCHDLHNADDGGLRGWMDGPLAVDAARVARLRGAGYRVYTQTIPAAITPKNRLLMAEPE